MVSRRNVHPGQSTKKLVTYNRVASKETKKLANNNQNVSTHDEISGNVASQTSTLRLKAGSPSSPLHRNAALFKT